MEGLSLPVPCLPTTAPLQPGVSFQPSPPLPQTVAVIGERLELGSPNAIMWPAALAVDRGSIRCVLSTTLRDPRGNLRRGPSPHAPEEEPEARRSY